MVDWSIFPAHAHMRLIKLTSWYICGHYQEAYVAQLNRMSQTLLWFIKKAPVRRPSIHDEELGSPTASK